MAHAIRIIKGDRQGETFRIPAGGRLVIGRDLECDVQLLEDSLSRTHLEIASSPSGVTATDLHSSNGSFLNGRRIEAAALSAGDVLKLGEVELELEEVGEDAAPSPPVSIPTPSSVEFSGTIRKRFKATVQIEDGRPVMDVEDPEASRIARHLEAIYRIATLVNAFEDLPGIFTALIETVHEIFKPDRSMLFIEDTQTGIIRPVISRGGAVANGAQTYSSHIVDESARGGHSILTRDASRDQRYSSKFSVVLGQIQSVMCVPIEAGREIFGALYVDSMSEAGSFTEDDLELLAAIGKQAGVAIRRTILIDERRQVEASLRDKEEQLRQAQKLEAIGRLSGGVAHDFNNLLAVITGHADLALMDIEEGTEAHESVTEIRAASERAASLTQQLLAFSRKQVLDPRIIDLNETVAETQKMIGRLIGEDIELTTAPEPRLGRIKADPGQIQQVLMNIVVNARDAMPTGGKLTIETRNVDLDADALEHVGVQPGPYVLLTISDTGSGMGKDTQDHIFEPFFTTKDQGKGTGLGLATVHGIVKQSGGEIMVYSEPGHGTSFKIYMPRVEEEPTRETPRAAGVSVLTGSEVLLVVEDDKPLLTMIGRMLEPRGYTVLAASTAEDALEVFARTDGLPVLLLTDIVLPRMSGTRLAESLLSRKPNLKVIFMSGYSDEAVVQHGFIDKGHVFIQKPFTSDAIATRIREVLEAK